MYKQYKIQIIRNKGNLEQLKIFMQYLVNQINENKKGNKTTLTLNELLRLKDLILDFVELHLNNKQNKTLKNNYTNKVKSDIENPINNSFLFKLLNNLDSDIINTNDYLISLFNLLSDNNYNINYIGVKVNIAKYLSNINLKDLKVLKVKNNYLSDRFSFLSFKNDKTKQNNTKLLFINNLIIINCLDSDRIYSFVIYHKDNTNIENIHQNTINENIKTIDIKNIDIKSKQYTFNDKEEQFTYNCSKLIALFKLNKNINECLENLSIFDKVFIIRKYINLYYDNDKIYNTYLDIENYLKSNDEFLSNDINNIKSYFNDYENFNYNDKELKLFSLDSY